MSDSPKRPRGRPTAPSARYRAVADAMRKRIDAGEYGYGKAIPSLRRLAAEFGVGRSVAADAVAMLKKEERLVPSGYRRLLTARSLGKATSTMSGVVLQLITTNMARYFTTPQSYELQRGIQLGVGELDAPLLMVHGGALRRSIPGDLLDRPLRGILLTGIFTRAALRRHEQLAIPVVLCDFPLAGVRLHSASVDNEAAAFDATHRLIALGHREIAFVRLVQVRIGEVDPDSLQRQAGYERAILESGLGRKRVRVVNAANFDRPDSPNVRRLLSESPVTAVLASDPERARIVREAALAMGKRIPQDFSIACFQGASSGRAVFSGPRSDFAELGRQAALLLAKPRRPHVLLKLPAPWHEGRTHGPAPNR